MSITEIETALRAVQVHPTAQRIAVCQYVLNSHEHPTAETVKKAVDKNFPKISLATVYNTLNTLVHVGLVKAINFPHSGKVVFDRNTSFHHHFIDEESGELTDIDSDQVHIEHELPNNFAVDTVEVFLRGKKSN